MLGYLSVDIICSSKLTVFLELRSGKTVRFSEQIMSADKIISEHIFAPNEGYCLFMIIIITLFMSQMYLAEHRGSTNWGDRKWNRHKSSQIKCWFLGREENRSTRGKTSWSRVEDQRTQPTFDVRSGNRTRASLVEGQCSHHCANTALVLLVVYAWFPYNRSDGLK